METQMGLGETMSQRNAPLADRMRPQTLDEVVGQPQLTGGQALLATSIAAKRPYSFVLYGPPGTGKTTIAMAAARGFGLAFEQLNAISDGVGDLRKVIERAKERRRLGEGTLLFLDEIGRWSKSQQDGLLDATERGFVVLIGATTENPAFELNRALRSRLKIERVRALSDADLSALADRALADRARGLGDRELRLSDGAREVLLHQSDGDARALLTGLESAALLTERGGEIARQDMLDALGTRSFPGKTEHYDLASALIKSIRGSDPDAALYWLARMEATGEDPRFIARRLLVSAAEEVGMAAPGALAVANAGFEATTNLGAPECWLVLAEVTCYLAVCPKSWASYKGLAAARALVADNPAFPVPLALRNASDAMAREDGAGEGYTHASELPPGSPRVAFLPPELAGAQTYSRHRRGAEADRNWERRPPSA